MKRLYRYVNRFDDMPLKSRDVGPSLFYFLLLSYLVYQTWNRILRGSPL